MVAGCAGSRVDSSMVWYFLGEYLASGDNSMEKMLIFRGSKGLSHYGSSPFGSQDWRLQPKISVRDFWYILSDPTREQLAHRLIVGQRAVWPKIHMAPSILARWLILDLTQTPNRATDWTRKSIFKVEGYQQSTSPGPRQHNARHRLKWSNVHSWSWLIVERNGDGPTAEDNS